MLACAIGIVSSAPQGAGQSFSSSIAIGPDGKVVENSIYVDTEGNKIVNGVNLKTKPNQGQPSVAVLSRPDWDSQKTPPRAGAYMHDDSGKYKGK